MYITIYGMFSKLISEAQLYPNMFVILNFLFGFQKPLLRFAFPAYMLLKPCKNTVSYLLYM